MLSSKSNSNSSSVQEQKEDHSQFNGQLNGKILWINLNNIFFICLINYYFENIYFLLEILNLINLLFYIPVVVYNEGVLVPISWTKMKFCIFNVTLKCNDYIALLIFLIIYWYTQQL